MKQKSSFWLETLKVRHITSTVKVPPQEPVIFSIRYSIKRSVEKYKKDVFGVEYHDKVKNVRKHFKRNEIVGFHEANPDFPHQKFDES